MKKLLSIACLLTSAILFLGCPYDSEVPIDKPSVKINPKLIGAWEPRNNQDESYVISKKDAFTYSIEKTNKKSKEKDNQVYLAYTSMVNGTAFLNLWENTIDTSSIKYYLYKLEMTGDAIITLAEVTENIDERFTVSVDLKNFISANMKNSYFFSKEETSYIRTGN